MVGAYSKKFIISRLGLTPSPFATQVMMQPKGNKPLKKIILNVYLELL